MEPHQGSGSGQTAGEGGQLRHAPAPGPQWRRPLIAAAVTLVLAVLTLVLGYQRMRDDAETPVKAAVVALTEVASARSA
jgi:hypothetical protein